jgi:hypothetical protein
MESETLQFVLILSILVSVAIYGVYSVVENQKKWAEEEEV